MTANVWTFKSISCCSVSFILHWWEDWNLPTRESNIACCATHNDSSYLVIPNCRWYCVISIRSVLQSFMLTPALDRPITLVTSVPCWGTTPARKQPLMRRIEDLMMQLWAAEITCYPLVLFFLSDFRYYIACKCLPKHNH